MVYSSRSRKGLSLRLHGRRKSPPYCICDPLGIVPMEKNTVGANECSGGFSKIYELMSGWLT